MNIFLIGLMGSGKTHWSKQLSKHLNISAYDLDHAIENEEAKTVAEIFTEKGEQYFRQKENEVLKSFVHKKDFVLSTGGGAPCFHDNIDWMNANGITIWIDEPIPVIVERLKKEKAHRPLIAKVADEDLEDFFYRMRQKREPFYSKSQHQLITDITIEKFIEILSLHE